MKARPRAVVLGAVVVGTLTAAGAAALYYIELPAHPGPENASPPPEAFGLMFGALIGCGLAAGLVAFVARSTAVAGQSVVLAFLTGSAYWLADGSDGLSDRVAVTVFAAILCALGAALGIALARFVRRPR